jgi:hypothetical protein
MSFWEDRELEGPLPHYGLVGAFTGERWLVTDTWDLGEIGHRPREVSETIGVVTIRRTTRRLHRGQPRVAISTELARETVTNALVLPTWRAGDEDPSVIRTRIANDDAAWTASELTFEGEQVVATEGEYRGRWVIYHLTATVIMLVASAASARPDTIEVRAWRLRSSTRRGPEAHSPSRGPAASTLQTRPSTRIGASRRRENTSRRHVGPEPCRCLDQLDEGSRVLLGTVPRPCV